MQAVDSGRQRQLLQQAQALGAEIRALTLDPASVEASLPKLFELARYVKRFIDTTACMPQDQTRLMWEQRGKWLQEEVAALTTERLQAGSPDQLPLQVMHLMFSAAQVCDIILREKADQEHQLKEVLGRTIAGLEAQLAAQQQQVQELQAQLTQQQAAAAAAAQVAISQQQLREEVQELRLRLVITQQDAHKHAADQQDSRHQLQMAVAERDQLHERCNELSQEVAELKEAGDRQVEVIRQLMERSEQGSSTQQHLAAEVGQLQQHNKTLSINLESHAQVIEKLIELNTELMDKSNLLAFTAKAASAAAVPGILDPMGIASDAAAPGLTAWPAAAAAHEQPGAVGLPGSAYVFGSHPQPSSSGYPSPPVSYSAAAPPSVSGQHSWHGAGHQQGPGRSSFDYSRGPPPPAAPVGFTMISAAHAAPHPAWLPPAGVSPISEQTYRSQAAATAQAAAPATSSSAAAAAAAAPSLTDAFSAFLMQPDEPKQATATQLAAPALAPVAPAQHSGGGRQLGGIFSTAKHLVNYVAGSHVAGQPGKQPVGGAAAPNAPRDAQTDRH